MDSTFPEVQIAKKSPLRGLLLPFQIGAHRKGNDGLPDQTLQDGYISSLLTFLLLLGLGLSLSVARWITSHQTMPISAQTVEICLMVYMLTDFAIMLRYIMIETDDVVDYQDEAKEKGDSEVFVKKYIKTKLVIIGLVVFYIFGIFVDGFAIITGIDCIEAYSLCGRFGEYLSNILFHSVRLMFMSTIVIFAVTFDGKTFVQKVKTHYSIMILAVGVLTIWLDGVLYEFSMIVKKHNQEGNTSVTNIACDQGIHFENLSDHQKHCLTKDTNLYHLKTTVSHFLYSFNVEFALLATKILGTMFFSMKMGSTILPNREKEHDSGHCVSVAAECTNTIEFPAIVPNSDDKQPPASEPGNQTSERDNVPLIVELPDHNVNTITSNDIPKAFDSDICCCTMKYPSVPIVMIFSVLINLVFVIFSVLAYNEWIIHYTVVEIIYWVPMIASAVIGFRASRDLVSDYKPYTGLELMVLVCTMGIFCYDLFALFSIGARFAGSEWLIDSPHKPPEYPNPTLTYISLFEKLSNITEAYIQASFMLYSRRVRFDNSHSNNNRCWYKVFRECLIYLAISNLVMWGNDSFVKVKNPAVELVMAYYYGSQMWALIIHMTFPFALFYRFNSFLLFTQIALKH